MLSKDIKVLDANIVLRFLVEDSEAVLFRTRRLLSSKEKFLLTDVTVAEIVWVLLSYYRQPKETIVEKLLGLLDLPSITAGKSLLTRSLLIFREYRLDYIDAYLAALTQEEGYSGIVSFDRSLDKVKFTKRFEP